MDDWPSPSPSSSHSPASPLLALILHHSSSSSVHSSSSSSFIGGSPIAVLLHILFHLQQRNPTIPFFTSSLSSTSSSSSPSISVTFMDPHRAFLKSINRIVVKVGTVVVTGSDGRLALGRLGALCEQDPTSQSHLLVLVPQRVLAFLATMYV